MSKSVRGCFRIMKIQKYKHRRSIEARRNWWQFNDNGRARKGVSILIWNYIIFGKESTSNINIEKTAAVVAVAAVAALEAVNDGASCRSLHPITKWWFIVQTKDTARHTRHTRHWIQNSKYCGKYNYNTIPASSRIHSIPNFYTYILLLYNYSMVHWNELFRLLS